MKNHTDKRLRTSSLVYNELCMVIGRSTDRSGTKTAFEDEKQISKQQTDGHGLSKPLEPGMRATRWSQDKKEAPTT